jgi:hypothetical protein
MSSIDGNVYRKFSVPVTSLPRAIQNQISPGTEYSKRTSIDLITSKESHSLGALRQYFRRKICHLMRRAVIPFYITFRFMDHEISSEHGRETIIRGLGREFRIEIGDGIYASFATSAGEIPINIGRPVSCPAACG